MYIPKYYERRHNLAAAIEKSDTSTPALAATSSGIIIAGQKSAIT